MSEATRQPDSPPRFYVEARPGGGWTVRINGHDAPVSRHDTEDEAHAKALAYRRGVGFDPAPSSSAARSREGDR